MSNSVVKCVTEPCVTACPDMKMVVHPPALCLTLPGISLTTDPGQCLVETKTSCLTKGADGCSPEVVTKSSGVRAISGGDTPCCTTACPDSQLIIQPPPICIMLLGPRLTSYPNECLIETSSPCTTTGTHPHALTHSTSASDGSLTPYCLSRSASFPSDLNRGPACVTQGPSHKMTICPPPIEVSIPGPIVEVAAQECVVEVYSPCETSGAITSGGECNVKTLIARAESSVHGVTGDPSCVTQGPDLKITICPPPFEVDLPGPILKVFPESCQVKAVNPCTPQSSVLPSCKPQALCGGSTPSTALSTTRCAMKRPLPDIRRPSRPWGEMYSRSMTPRSVMAQRVPFSRCRAGSFQTAF